MNLNDLKNFFGLHEKSFVPNVGIGTTAPNRNLDVYTTDAAGEAKIAFRGSNIAQGVTGLGDTADTGLSIGTRNILGWGGGSIYGYSGGSSVPGVSIIGVSNAPAATTPSIWLSGSKKNGAANTILSASDLVLQISNQSNPLMTVLGDGKVGIGTTTPARLLHVNGPVRITPAALPGTPAAGELAFDSGASNALKFYDGSAWQTVGTGTGNGDFLRNGSLAMTGDFNAGGNRVLGNSTASANLELESTSNSTKGFILLQKNGGAVGVGTTNPTAALDVYPAASSWTTSIRGQNDYTSGSNVANLTGINGTVSFQGAGSVTDTVMGINALAMGLGGPINKSKGFVSNSFNSGGNVTSSYGAEIMSQISPGATTTTVTTGYGVDSYVDAGGGTVTTGYGGRFRVIKGSGSVGTGYGVYIGTVSATTPYSLYSANTAPSYFQGNVGVGTNAPTRLLDVAGPIHITPAALPSSPAAGELAFDSGASNALKFYDGSAWQTVGTGTGSGDFLRNGSLAMTGNFNAGGNSVLGNTTASANLILESTSNATKGFVNIQPNGGFVGIGTSTPTTALDVMGAGSVTLNSLGTTSTDGLVLTNTTPASVGAPQTSPRIHLHSSGWDTTNGVAKSGDVILESPNYSGSATASGMGVPLFKLSVSAGGGAYASAIQVDQYGNVITPFLWSTSGVTAANGTFSVSKTAGIATTSTDGVASYSSTAATAGVPVQMSPRFRLRGNVWDSGASANRTSDWVIEDMPVSGNPASDVLRIGNSWNGAAYTFPMVISSGGSVGVGTDSPARLLHVNGPMRVTPAALPGTPAAGDLAFDSGASNALKYHDGSAWIAIGSGNGDFLRNGSLAMTGNFNAGGNQILGNTTASANLDLESTSNATKGHVLIQKNGGYVGIGTTSPAEKLEVNGAIKLGDTASTCDSSHRGVLKFVAGGAGVEDRMYTCLRAADGTTYSWTVVANGGASCGGYSYGGGCWYAGTDGQSCTTVCAGRGGYDSATETVAGSSGSDGACTNLISYFYPSGSFDSAGSLSYGGLGCVVVDDLSGTIVGYRDTDTTTAGGAVTGAPFTGAYRICSCAN